MKVVDMPKELTSLVFRGRSRYDMKDTDGMIADFIMANSTTLVSIEINYYLFSMYGYAKLGDHPIMQSIRQCGRLMVVRVPVRLHTLCDVQELPPYLSELQVTAWSNLEVLRALADASPNVDLYSAGHFFWDTGMASRDY